ncbi:hypothetical protein SKAU_G00262540 [Synaphobranchus kaupii]|uniref:Secreted protein n=1 Tax=Synaphobranchus kaupii TaxID=118154 RepID=A0A9Q1EYN2_SYNKA|nr:hypothetical protein SKAU_G00262540 [Synaphobranchus kaupii]
MFAMAARLCSSATLAPVHAAAVRDVRCGLIVPRTPAGLPPTPPPTDASDVWLGVPEAPGLWRGRCVCTVQQLLTLPSSSNAGFQP